ncbi:hypothetical protein [Arcticibacterium luteifluviistationis]|uniref:Uncharacterized protein n=1 Tax=Arcticibacterium luteifluviistationis TaxID=1784714 RepID=A0A2Z4GFV8_9BACT|nr:hypothetical protein [Arcticibacterium luteifluviistationis]AWW00197.1 hypothetical protein DJ013_19280 [Arcticibacterium luteifluviistationis]
MKYIFTLVFCLAGMVSFAQQATDENGRPVGSKPALTVSSEDSDIYLRKSKEKSSSSSLVVEYSLPFGKTGGKLVLFHPRKDEELKSIDLSGNHGSVVIDTKALGFEGFNAGLYLTDGTFVKSQSIY